MVYTSLNRAMFGIMTSSCNQPVKSCKGCVRRGCTFYMPAAASWVYVSGHQSQTSCITFHPQSTLTQSPQGINMASCDQTGVVKLWNLENDEPIADIEGHSPHRVSRVTFHPSGRFLGTAWLVIVNTFLESIYVLDAWHTFWLPSLMRINSSSAALNIHTLLTLHHSKCHNLFMSKQQALLEFLLCCLQQNIEVFFELVHKKAYWRQ